jgi:exoribonuclease-2
MMIPEKSLVAYKNRPALVDQAAEKVSITLLAGEQLKVREKDIELIYPGPCVLSELRGEGPAAPAPDDLQGARELLEGGTATLKELAELVYGDYTARTSWGAYALLRDGLYFSGTIEAVSSRPPEEVAAEERKRAEKQREADARDRFVRRFAPGGGEAEPFSDADGADSRRFFQEIEALAYKRTDKNLTLRRLGRPETPVEAHRLLLSSGFWTPLVNPHPARLGLSLCSAKTPLPPPPEEDRVDLTHLVSLAVDNAWSDDPDDAVSIEGNTLYVHVADPAASLEAGSAADREARDRGATLYLPEGVFRMMHPEALGHFALGIHNPSPALSFKLTLDEDGAVAETEIMRSLVTVRRMSYAEADAVEGRAAGFGAELALLSAVADRNIKRRIKAGAAVIAFPETHIELRDGEISITPITNYASAAMVRECMLMAGEGAAEWAVRRRVPFPYVAQETEGLPNEPLSGLAGAYQIRRCMRPRVLSAKPGAHKGLGLAAYTQVTSPLRRYIDLLAHQQIRAVLRGETPLSENEVLMRLAAGEAAANAAGHAERLSRGHWTAVYLSGKKNSRWEAVALERRGARTVFMIPSLGLETQTALKRNAEPNETVSLILAQVSIPESEISFTAER